MISRRTPHTTALTQRFFYACIKYGWVAVIAALLLLAGCDDLQTYAASHADLADAIAQASSGGLP